MTTKDTIMALATAYADKRVLAIRGQSTQEDVVAADQALRSAVEAALAPQQVPEPLTARELELIDEMIGVQLAHAMRCDQIANWRMAEKQKGWDMERVALLQKVKAAAPQPAPQPAKWVGFDQLPQGDITFFKDRGDAVDGYSAERVWEIISMLREKNGGAA